MNIIKNMIKNELYLLVFLILSEVLRLLMKAGDYLAIEFTLVFIMVIAVALLSIIQQIVKERFMKKRDSIES